MKGECAAKARKMRCSGEFIKDGSSKYELAPGHFTPGGSLSGVRSEVCN